MTKITFAISTLLLTAQLAAAASGAAISSDVLRPADRASLTKQIASARKAKPAAFAGVAALRGQLAQMARSQRSRRLVNVVMPLRSLRSDGLMPMLAELAFDAKPRGSQSTRAWRGWRVSLLEAVGSLRATAAAPVLEAIVGSERDAAVIRAAARALGRLGTDRAARLLIKHARQQSARGRAVLAALGECRRASVARALEEILGRAKTVATQRAAIAALGQVGNFWAWRTPSVRNSGEGDTTRRIAARALISKYPQLSFAHREQAAKALLLISHPNTAAMVTLARSRSTQAAAFDVLSRRLARQPTLRRR